MPIIDKDSRSIRLARRCMGYFLPYKLYIAIAVAAMLLVSLLTGASAYLVKPAMDDIFINKNERALIFIPILYILVVTAEGAARYAQNYFMQRMSLQVLEELRAQLFGKIIRLPLKYYEDTQVGLLMSRVISDVMLIRSSLPSLVMLVRQVLTMIFLVGVVLWQDVYLALWALVVIPLAIWPIIYFGKKLRNLSRKNQVRVADLTSFLQESFSGIRVVKAFANERGETGRFRKENKRLLDIGLKQVVYTELSSPVMEIVGSVGMGLVIWYGGSRVIAGESTPGTFFSFLAAIIMLYDPFKKFNAANNDVQKALAGAERVFDILDSEEIVEERGGEVAFAPPFENLEFRDVTFSYPGVATPAVNGMSLRINAGQRVAVVGPSGAGKSTLVNLIPRFYLPGSGQILLNGRDLSEYTLDSLRLHIGMVSQDAFLFNASVAENIAYSQPSVDMARVEEAARTAYAHDFIAALPEGYATVIGERGVKLSGGQKQRLTIARALFKNPPLLILDEATSALDTESERIVQLALENLMQGRTSIVIAHRLSTVLSADVIVVMEQGRVVGQGSHAQLLESCPLYAKLYRMQFQDGMPEEG